MASVVVREAGETDVPRVLELYAQLTLGPDDVRRLPDPARGRQTFEEMSRQPGFHLLVAETDGTVQGSIVLVIVPNFSYRNRPFAVIENVIVDGEHRRHGIGAALMAQAAAVARDAGCYKVMLSSNRQRPEAHRFYGRLGYVQTHEAFHLRFED